MHFTSQDTATSGSRTPLRKMIDPDGPHLERLILLSDGVFAIAMTLLALEIHGPEHWNGDGRALALALGPALVAYVTAFAVLAITWQTHRHTLALFERIDGVATGLNLALLAVVAVLPPVMRFTLESSIGLGLKGFEIAIWVYGGTIAALGVLQMLLWGWAALIGGLMKPYVPKAYRRNYFFRWLFANLSLFPLLNCGRLVGAKGQMLRIDPIWAVAFLVLMAGYVWSDMREKAALKQSREHDSRSPDAAREDESGVSGAAGAE